MLVVLSKSLDASFNAWEMTSLYDKVKDEALSMRDFSMRVLSILTARLAASKANDFPSQTLTYHQSNSAINKQIVVPTLLCKHVVCLVQLHLYHATQLSPSS